MSHKHLGEVDPDTLSPTELRERLRWRDEHPAEVIRAEREREAHRRLDQKMADAKDGFLLSGGDPKDWSKAEREIRDDLVREEAKAAAEAEWRRTCSEQAAHSTRAKSEAARREMYQSRMRAV